MFVVFSSELIPRPASQYEDPPLHLCLKIGKPINKRVSKTCPIDSYGKKRKKPEYWFSIPRERWVSHFSEVCVLKACVLLSRNCIDCVTSLIGNDFSKNVNKSHFENILTNSHLEIYTWPLSSGLVILLEITSEWSKNWQNTSRRVVGRELTNNSPSHIFSISLLLER